MADNFANIKIGVDDDADQALKRINSAIKSVQSQVVNVKVQPNTDALKDLKAKDLEVGVKVDDAALSKLKDINVGVDAAVNQPASSGGAGVAAGAIVGSAFVSGGAANIKQLSTQLARMELSLAFAQKEAAQLQSASARLGQAFAVASKEAKESISELLEAAANDPNLELKMGQKFKVGGLSKQTQRSQEIARQKARLRDEASKRAAIAQAELKITKDKIASAEIAIDQQKKLIDKQRQIEKGLKELAQQNKKLAPLGDRISSGLDNFGKSFWRVFKFSLKVAGAFAIGVKIVQGIAVYATAFASATGSTFQKMGEAGKAFADGIPILRDVVKAAQQIGQIFVLGQTLESAKKAQDKLNKKANEKAKAVEAINKSVKDYVDAILFASNTFALSGDQAKIFQILEDRNKKIAQVLNSNNLSITQKQEALAKIFEASTKAAETASTVRDLGSAVSPQDDKARKELDALVAAQQAAMQASINRVLAINEAAVNTSASARKAQAELNKKIDDSQKLLNMALARQSFSGEQYAALSKGHQELLAAAKKQRAQAKESAAQRAKIQQDGLAQQASIQQELTKSITEKRQELNKKNIEAQKEAAEKAKKDLQASVAASIDDKNFKIDADPLAQRIKSIKKSMDDIDKSIEQAGKKGVDTSNLKSQAQIKRAQANKLIEDVTKKFTEQAIEKFTKTLEDTLNSNTGLLISGQKEVQQLRKLQQQIQKAKNPQSISTFQAQSINAQQEIAKEELKLKKKTSQQALKREQQQAKLSAKNNQQLLKIEEAFQAKRLAQSKLFASEQQKIALQKALQIAKLGEEQIKAEQDLAEKTKAVRDAFNSTIQSSTATSGLAARAGISKRIEQSVLETQKKALQQQKKANVHLEQIAKNKAVFAQ